MGTTLVAAIVLEGGAVILNVGDSRAYLISRTERIRQITRDHSVVEDMIQRGEITRAEAKTHPNRNFITQAIGTSDNVECDIFYTPMQKNDILMLCSDGLTNIVDDEIMSHEILKSEDLRVCCEGLVHETVVRGAPDNVTAVLYRK
jgi:PPM family protein phosphatase